MVLNADWRLHALSDNLSDMLGAENPLQAGDDLGDSLGRQFVHDSRGWAQGLDADSGVVRCLVHEGAAGNLDLSITQVGERYVVSFEPARQGKPVARDALVQRFLYKLRPLTDIDRMAAAAAMQIRMFTQFDHVAILSHEGDRQMQVLAQSGADAFALPSSLTSLSEVLPDIADVGTAGMITDIEDEGFPVQINGNASAVAELARSPLILPQTTTIATLSEQGVRSALWFPMLGTNGPIGMVLCRRSMPRHCDVVRRAATDLAVQYLALLLQTQRRH